MKYRGEHFTVRPRRWWSREDRRVARLVLMIAEEEWASWLRTLQSVQSLPVVHLEAWSS